MEMLLLCHGVQDPGGRFTVNEGQTLKYRWNFGTKLYPFDAARLVQLLYDDPGVSDERIRMEIAQYNPPPPVIGPTTAAPNIQLGGGDDPPCYWVNITMQTWAPLDGSWRSDLDSVLSGLAGVPLTLNLLSCSELPKIDLMQPHLADFVQHDNWQSVARGVAPPATSAAAAR
ncbi:hypothetical protein Cs7R123_09790 [Catellatospora sp. TT07R-123]|uniref:hypothetical protein n=1 Tax=Catellatospora sp. TT07R-123 TaxID=2733863 RepID=UPI001B06B0ED|nr:hypothetical protein [Catellatospora sp. TT07R-123]GHJ43637.1 hypothetical protein Cs7R123_09790 [Catellatospora sp. TT07R-123]